MLLFCFHHLRRRRLAISVINENGETRAIKGHPDNKTLLLLCDHIEMKWQKIIVVRGSVSDWALKPAHFRVVKKSVCDDERFLAGSFQSLAVCWPLFLCLQILRSFTPQQ